MSYNKHNFVDGTVLSASQLNEMDNQIAENETALNSKATKEYVDTQLATKITNPSGGSDGLVLTYTDDGIIWKNPQEQSDETLIVSDSFAYKASTKVQKTFNVDIEQGKKFRLNMAWNAIGDFTGVTVYYNGLDKVLDRFYPTATNEYNYSSIATENITSLTIYIGGSNITSGGTLSFNAYLKTETANINKSLIEYGVDISTFMNRASKTPIVTWIDDDTDSQLTGATYGIEAVKALADNLGIKCTFGCITNVLSTESVKNRLLEYQREGFHIASHSDTHTKGTSAIPFWYPESYTDVTRSEADLVDSLIKLQSNGFLNSNYFIVPGGNTSSDLSKMIDKYCECSVMADYQSGINHNFGNGRLFIHRLFIRPQSEGGLTLDGYKAKIDEAYENGDWLVFGTHSGMNAQWDETLINNVLSYAKTKGFSFETLHQAWNKRKYNYDLYDMFN